MGVQWNKQLLEACRSGDVVGVARALEGGAIQAEQLASVPNLILAAVANKHPAVAEALIQYTGITGDMGLETALIEAAWAGYDRLVVLLCERGAPVDAQCGAPILAAATRGHLRAVSALLDCGANIFALQGQNKRLLDEAARAGYADVVRYLLAKVPLLSDPSKNMLNFALAIAAQFGRVEVAAALIQAGADPDCRSGKCLRPRDLAEAFGKRDVVALFDAYAANQRLAYAGGEGGLSQEFPSDNASQDCVETRDADPAPERWALRPTLRL